MNTNTTKRHYTRTNKSSMNMKGEYDTFTEAEADLKHNEMVSTVYTLIK